MKDEGEQELKPCPFCGSAAGDIKLSAGHGYIIGCGMCQGQQFAMSRNEAVKLWNRRSTTSDYRRGVEDAAKVACALCAKMGQPQLIAGSARLWHWKPGGEPNPCDAVAIRALLNNEQPAPPVTEVEETK